MRLVLCFMSYSSLYAPPPKSLVSSPWFQVGQKEETWN
jgi:hypothetical protein